MIAALYIRVSSSEQIKGYSLDAQEDLLRRYAADHNMPVYKLYADEGKSANKALHKRTALLEMVKDAEAKRFDTILFKDITRWSRRSADYFVIQDRLDKCGCAWIAVEQPFLETRSPTGKFQVSIMLGVSQLESENNSQRVKFVRDNMVKNGVVPYSDRQAPIGYKVAEIGGIRRLIKDPETSDMVTDMFRYLWEYRNAAATRRYIQEKYGIAFDRFCALDVFVKNLDYTKQDSFTEIFGDNPETYLLYQDCFSGMFDLSLTGNENKMYKQYARKLALLKNHKEYGYIFENISVFKD